MSSPILPPCFSASTLLETLELKDFKLLLTKKEFKACLESKSLQKTWYSVTLDVFISFLFRICFLSFALYFSKSLQL